jgi:hypothetical protein
MDVRTFPNQMRPGVGQKPRRESQRPTLPQHARHCPVLEAGSSLGFLVYPSLGPTESFYLEYRGDGAYRFAYYVSKGGKFDVMFTVTYTMPPNGVGMIREEVGFPKGVPIMSKEAALAVARTFLVPEDMGTPAGALSLRGNTNFQTPPGWDTVYTPIFNMLERPAPPMMVVRVETDWFAHETEFRYVLEPGEGITAQHNMPIGQVMFVPREEITLVEGTAEELAARNATQMEFIAAKAGDRLQTPYGMSYSPHYLKKSREYRHADPKDHKDG